jgi:hypothetical protein
MRTRRLILSLASVLVLALSSSLAGAQTKEVVIGMLYSRDVLYPIPRWSERK